MDTQDIAKFCLRALQIPQTQIKLSFRWIAAGYHQKLLILRTISWSTSKVKRIPLILLSNFWFFRMGSEYK
jgi:hypothetical protein